MDQQKEFDHLWRHVNRMNALITQLQSAIDNTLAMVERIENMQEIEKVEDAEDTFLALGKADHDADDCDHECEIHRLQDETAYDAHKENID